MEFLGYGGNILYVDLTSGHIRKEPLDIDLVRNFIGGCGINYKLAYDLIAPDVDPLCPDNSIIIGAGPFSGTIIPASSKLMITTKLPGNGAFATCVGGGLFHIMMKSSGYDHIVISGRSEKPVYLKICDDNIELCDAADLWGKADSFETVDILRKKYEPCSVIPIGPAGENLVPISATMVDKLGHIGSGGLPAVMGSKNLKAVVAVQGTRGTTVADRSKLVRIVDGILQKMREWPRRERLLRQDIVEECLDSPEPKRIDYWERPNFSEDVKKGLVERHIKVRRVIACPGCPMSCKSRVRLVDGAQDGKVFYASHFHCLHEGKKGLGTTADEIYDVSVSCIEMLDRYGICTFHFRDVVSVSTHLYEAGVLTKEDTGGLEIKDDLETFMKLMRMVAHREGFGDVLAEGMVKACRKIGRGAENYVAHTKGRAPTWDTRLKPMGTEEFNQFVDPRGGMIREAAGPARVPNNPPAKFARYGIKIGVPEEAIERIVGEGPVNLARWTRYEQDWVTLYNSLGLCALRIPVFFNVKMIAELYTALTGIEMTAPEIMKAAERSFNLYKVLNVRAGFGRDDDNPPEAWFTPIKDQDGREHPMTDYYGNILTREDVKRWIDDYYDERGWDTATGAPRPQKLRELGLEWVALDHVG